MFFHLGLYTLRSMDVCICLVKLWIAMSISKVLSVHGLMIVDWSASD